MFNHNGREKKMAAALAAVNGLGLLTPLTAPLAATFEDNGAAEAAKIIKGGGQLVDRLYFKTAAAYTGTVSSGTVSGETVDAGTQNVEGSGSVISTTINNGGEQNVHDNGSATDTIINNGGEQHVYFSGSVTDATINNGGLQQVSYNGSATGTTITSGGQQVVRVNGSATGTIITSGGQQLVYDAGISSGTKIYNGGVQKVFTSNTKYFPGGTDHGTTIFSGGKQEVYSGGTASGTHIENGGLQSVSAGGTVSNTIVSSGGTQAIGDGGTARGTTVQSGGLQTVANGGTAVSTTVQSGGKQTVANGGIISATVVNEGGIQELADGAVVDGNMTLIGTLEISTDSMDIADTLTAISGSTVQFKNGGSPKTLNIGTLQGSTNFVINTDIVSGTSDKINITDATSSTNTVQIGYDPCFLAGAGTTNASDGGVTFATVTSGGTENTFKAKETEYSAYKFTPTITNTSTTSGTEYKIASIFGEGSGDDSGGDVTAGSLVYTAGDAAGMALTAIRAENNNLTKRMGELRRSDKASGVWVRSYGGEQTVDTSIRRAEQNYHGLQGGYDKVKELANGKLFAGYTVGYLKATGDLERGDSDNSSLSLGLYGSWLGDKGHYFDIIAKRSRQNNSYRTYLDNGLNTRLDADYRTHGTTLGMEYGYRKELKDGYYLEPQAELIYSRIGGVDYKVSDGTEASQASIRSLIGRIGATYGKRTDHQNYYIKLSAAREFTAKERVRMHLGSMSAVGMEESLKESWLEIALGLTGTAGRNSDYYVELTKTTGDKVKEDWQASVGMRWKF